MSHSKYKELSKPIQYTLFNRYVTLVKQIIRENVLVHCQHAEVN